MSFIKLVTTEKLLVYGQAVHLSLSGIESLITIQHLETIMKDFIKVGKHLSFIIRVIFFSNKFKYLPIIFCISLKHS